MRLKFARRWRGEEDGATAVEFALLAVPFMLLVVGIIEMSLMFLAGSLLEGAVNDAARLIRTGQLQTAGGSSDDQKEAFLKAVCDHAGMLLDCSRFQYQVIKLDSFNDDITPKFDEDGNLIDKDKFDLDQITSGCIAIVRVMYYYPLLTPLLSTAFSDSPNNTHLLMSTTAFETEPYQFGSAGC
jgi:Flp pilus assembly pilin Flp